VLSPICNLCPCLVFEDAVIDDDGVFRKGKPLCIYDGEGVCADEEGLL